ncbi:autotransporter domain-containing protein [uncultured Sutterella sp.]|uniref:autotransporter domain-containing protein n=1 Tax=uncultured Sutterella sp. TaxID=286133 RepID=UPI00266C6B53|nr:autotransporter domain-containing protein [uncultured Sutterella sp.]
MDATTVSKFDASYDNTAFGVSAEIGYRWDVSKIFYLTPQAELSYGYVRGEDFTGSNGIRVDQDNFETLVGRVGFQAGANFAEGAGTVYLTASLNHDFRGEAEASAVRGDSAVQRLYEDLGGTWVSH